MKLSLSSYKKGVLIFLLCYLPGISLAQRVNPDTLDIDQLNLYKHKAVNLRNAGMAVTFAGVGTIITGIILGNIPDKEPHDDTGDPSHDGISIWTVAFVDMVGVSVTLAGIPLWAVGGSRNAKAKVALKKFNTLPDNSMALGVGITIYF